MLPTLPNLLTSLPSLGDAEVTESLITEHGIRLQRIISFGQVSPEGLWYDQKEAEWVMLLTGHARLVIAGGRKSASWDQVMPCICPRIGEGERVMTGVEVLDGEEMAGHRFLQGTDLDIVHNLQGDNLVLRVNKASVLVFRAILRDAVPPLLESRLRTFNSFAPDFVFTIGDTEEGLNRMLRSAGIVDEPPAPQQGLLAWLMRRSS
jgi:hypothetical protein